MISLIFTAVILLVRLVPIISGMKLILMYASCDDQLSYILHLLHRSIEHHLIQNKKDYVDNVYDKEILHLRHNLSDACMWVLQETIAVIAISNTTMKWKGIDTRAHDYNLPHFVSPNFCECPTIDVSKYSQYFHYLDQAVFEYLKDAFLHYVIILHEEESTGGMLLGYSLSLKGVRVSHLRITSRHRNVLKMVEQFFDAWNMVDLSDEGRLLISLGGGTLSDSVLERLVTGSMHNKRTKLLVLDKPEKWQRRLQSVKAYEVDIVVVSSDPFMLDDCPVAVELLPFGYHTHKTRGPCANLSSEHRALGDAIIQDFQSNFTKGCCPQSGLKELFFTFWQSWPYENGTQRLKPQAIWSESLGLMRMMPIDIETITLRIAVVEYNPYVLLDHSSGELSLRECVFKQVIEFLSNRLNFKYKLVRAIDDEWGTKVGPGEWDGALGMIIRGEADMVPYLTSTPSRREAIDYSMPLAYVKYGMLVAFPSEPPRAFIFLRPYKREVWFLFALSAFVVSFILYKIHGWSCKFCRPAKKYVKGLSTFCRCFWLIFGAMLNQGGVHLPATNSARLVLASWWLAVLVVMATFSANLIAFLAFPEARWVVKNLEDLLQHKTMKLIIKNDCPVLEDFSESNIEIYRRIRKVFLENPKRGKIVKVRRPKLVDAVAEGQTVIIDDVNYLNGMVERDYNMSGRCRVTIAPLLFSKMVLALGFRRGSSILEFVDTEIAHMQESGILTHWKARYSPQRDECFDFDPDLHGQSEITLEDLQGPFYLLLIGLICGLLILHMEFMWNKIKILCKKNSKRKPPKTTHLSLYSK